MSHSSKNSFLYRVLCGAFLGISIIAPGISGSIMAVMMGIYDELITIISNPFRNFKKNLIYAFPMCLGAGLSILGFLQILHFLFEHYPTPGYLLFISLIAGSIPTVLQEANRGGFKKRYLFGVPLAFLFALTIGMLAKQGVTLAVDPLGTNTPGFGYLSVCGLIAGVMSMIPGMSVSMVLMMLGVYRPLLQAAAGLDVVTIMPVAVCFVIGMVLFSRFTKFVFTKYRSVGYYAVLGFMSGSLISIFPALPVDLLGWVLSIAAIGVGLLISFIFKRLGRKFHADPDRPGGPDQAAE